jgi:hypothetical protein
LYDLPNKQFISGTSGFRLRSYTYGALRLLLQLRGTLCADKERRSPTRAAALRSVFSADRYSNFRGLFHERLLDSPHPAGSWPLAPLVCSDFCGRRHLPDWQLVAGEFEVHAEAAARISTLNKQVATDAGGPLAERIFSLRRDPAYSKPTPI